MRPLRNAACTWKDLRILQPSGKSFAFGSYRPPRLHLCLRVTKGTGMWGTRVCTPAYPENPGKLLTTLLMRGGFGNERVQGTPAPGPEDTTSCSSETARTCNTGTLEVVST